VRCASPAPSTQANKTAVDPELKAEFEERQKAQPNAAANPLQNFDAAAWLAGSTSSSSKKTEVPSNVERGITR
jgi:hypothetical protein